MFSALNRSGWLACLSVFRKMLETLVERRFSAVIFLFVFISFYISWYHFSQIFGSSFKNIRKKYFCHEFSFLTDLLRPMPPPLNGQNPLSVTKVFCWCSVVRLAHSRKNQTGGVEDMEFPGVSIKLSKK